MGLGFLVPAFLAGLAAIAIPVVIHLLNRERKEVVAFPSLMFLDRIPYRAIRRQRIRHPWLLLLRALALAALALAFARPFFSRDSGGAAGASGRELVILLDRSYSMGYGERWERALRAVRAELEALGSADRVTLVGFDEGAEVLAGPTANGSEAATTLAGLAPGLRTTRLSPALGAAREVLSRSPLANREVILVSDLQRSAWDGRSEGRLPAGVATRVISVADSSFENRLVTGIELVRDPGQSGTSVAIVARLINQGETAAPRQEVTLQLQGRVVERRQVDLPSRGAATVRFNAVPVPATEVAAAVSLAPDPLPADNVFHFTLSRGQVLPVLVIQASGAARRSLYLDRALALGTQPPFAVTVTTAGAVDPARLGSYPVIILNNVPFPSGTGGRALASHIRSGAGLIAVLGDGSDPRRWSDAGKALLPVDAGEIHDRAEGARLGSITRGHPVFGLFQAARSGDFTGALFQRYRALVPADSTAVLASFDDGRPALLEVRAGSGRVIAWSSTMDDFWNDFVVQPVWVPFIHSLVRYASGYAPEPVARTLGQQVRLPGGTDSAATRTVIGPGGSRLRLDQPGVLPLEQAGVYQVPGPAPGAPAHLFAANPDRGESEPDRWDPDELRLSITPETDSLTVRAEPAQLTPSERERGQRGWWLLLLAAAGLLAAELWVANRLAGPARGSLTPERL